MEDEVLEVVIRVRLTKRERDKAHLWAKAYGDKLSEFFRRMLRSLPEEPPTIPQPPVKP
jgi:TolB-like protein